MGSSKVRISLNFRLGDILIKLETCLPAVALLARRSLGEAGAKEGNLERIFT